MEIVQEVGEEVGKLCKDFTVFYIGALINSKLEDIMDEAVGAIMPDGLEDMMSGGGDEQDEVIEEKEAEEKEDVKPYVSGCCVISYKTGRGPDNLDHRYYDIACWSLKSTDSVIIKTVSRHTQLLAFTKSLKKQVKSTPNAPFPAKKLTTKRTPEFYKERMKSIHEYFETVTVSQDVTESDTFLDFFNLKYNEKDEYLRGIFFDALQNMCESMNINWNAAQKRAERVGIDLSQVDMLKVVAIEKLGKEAVSKLRAVEPPSYLPGKLKGRFISKAEAKLFGAIGSTVEAGWTTCSVAFDKVAETINDVLDKAVDPIKELLNKALEPLGSVVKEKFEKLQEAITISNDDLQGNDFDFISRFKPLDKALTDIKNKNGKFGDILINLLESIDDMNKCHKYVGYIQYNLGDPDGLIQYIPFLNDLANNHYRLTIALTDCAYIISRATVRAFIPIVKYLDEACDKFDENTHKTKLRDACREAGRKLAIDYFSLPSTLRRTTWYCGRYTEQLIIKLAKDTICGIANLIAQFAEQWTPADAASAHNTFVDSLRGPLNAFLNDRVSQWLNVVRRCMQDMISNKFFETVGSVVEELCTKLDDLCSKLPPPLCDYLKPGALIKYLFNKLCMNAIVFGVKKLAEPTEKLLYCKEEDGGAAKEMDEQLCRSLRWAPYIRNDDISFDPEKDDDNDDEAGDDETPDSPVPDGDDGDDQKGDE